METYVLRIRLPDRPGALGLVASRIGSVGVDIIAIDILQRSGTGSGTGGSAVDEFVVELEHPDLVDLLTSEIHEVDGVAIEEVRRIYRADFEDPADPAAGGAGIADTADLS